MIKTLQMYIIIIIIIIIISFVWHPIADVNFVLGCH